jgi:hypothetical protein
VRTFWPVAEAAQADYEVLRAAVLSGISPASTSWARFCRHGLAGLIAAPMSQPVFTAVLVGGTRPPWMSHNDPRVEALAAGYGLLLDDPADGARLVEVQ